MASIRVPAPTTRRQPAAARRFGYAVAIAVNGAMLWIANQLLDWGWPRFLTEEFREVLPLLSLSFVVSIVANLALLVRDRGRFRAFTDLTTALVGLVVSVRMWNVFPFDFTGYATDWSWLAHTLLLIAIIGTAIAAVVNLVKLLKPTDLASDGPVTRPG